MRLPSQKKSRRKNSAKQLGYENLESRQLLATLVAFDSGTGTLDITLEDNNDVATVDVASNGNITVNGSQDLSSAGGVQSAAAGDLRFLNIQGDSTMANQRVSLNGDFSNTSQQNTDGIQSVSIQEVTQATFNGVYDIAGPLNATIVGANGWISDGATGRVSVGSVTTINANNNEVVLDNIANDFVGVVNVTNGGVGRDITFADANNIRFANAISTGDFNVTAVGNVADPEGATISVDGIARFNAASVVFGDDTSDSTNFAAVNSTTTGDTILTEDSTVVLLNINAENLTVTTEAGIFDGRRSGINVNNLATFDSGTRIRIGENGTDTFNAGSLNFNSDGHIHITQNNNTVIVGDNTGASLSLLSEGNIGDAATASINVVGNTQLEGANIILGDTATDEFNSGAIHFNTWGDFDLDEDSSTLITESKNQANRLFLSSTGAITDSNTARLTVNLLSTFDAVSVNLGDTETDRFYSGSINFVTSGQFALSEDNSTNIVGNNSAQSSRITSEGAITNNFLAADGVTGTNIGVTTVASFTGTSVDLGREVGDTMNFGSLQLNTTGTSYVTEDSGTHLTMDSQVNRLILRSAGAVTDATTATTNVNTTASITGTSINLGDDALDTFDAGTVTLNSEGVVQLTEDSTLTLIGDSTASEMTLRSLNGNVLDTFDQSNETPGTTSTTVTGLLSVEGALINLASEVNETLEIGSFNFNSTGNTFVTADTGFEIEGDNSSNDRLILRSTGNITDSATAEILVETLVDIRAVDVIIGELATDCFDILSGPTNLSVVASGTRNVVFGGC